MLDDPRLVVSETGPTQVIFVRAQTTVAAARGKQANAGRSKLVPTYGITRGVHV